jgi:hypothetical protein
MKSEPENLTAQQSLAIITNMIQEAKGRARKNGFHFLLWGWVIVLANLGMYTLTKFGYPYPYAVWAITIPAWILSLYKGFRQEKEQQASTHFDRVSMWLWVSFGITVFTIVAFGYKLNYQINPLIIIVSAIPTFVSGVLLKFNPLMFGGAAFWIFGIVGFLTPVETQPLIGAVAILCGYLVPGYLLQSKKEY